MIGQLKTSYENMGTSSYLAVTFSPEAGLINYQLEMLAANEISHILPVSRRMINGETVVYYNITSKISLTQVLGRKKLKRKELICLLEGAIQAIRDAAEYQLPMTGLAMDPEYIYVDPANCEPGFIYLPMPENGGKGLKDLILDLIMQGKIEMSNDNFIQALLEAVNSQPLSIDRLEACLKQYQGTGNRNIQSAPPVVPVMMQTKEPEAEEILPKEEVKPSAPKMPPLPKKTEEKEEKTPKKEKMLKKEKMPQREKSVESDKNETEENFDAEAAKKKFLLPQAVIMVALAAAYSFGLFADESGALVIKNVFGVLACVALIEVVLYREAYVNSKNVKPNKKAKKTMDKKTEKTGKSLNEKPAMKGKKPAVPTRARSAAEPETVSNYVDKPEAAIVPEYPENDNKATAPGFVQPQSIRVPDYSQDTEIAGETEIWDGSQGNLAAYLEYYENGIMTRVPLDKASILVGRLSSQVDFAVSNPKVGKVHAEFSNCDGRFFVKDLSSKNGTYINGGSRINSNVSYPLNDRDIVRLADSEFTFHCS